MLIGSAHPLYAQCTVPTPTPAGTCNSCTAITNGGNIPANEVRCNTTNQTFNSAISMNAGGTLRICSNLTLNGGINITLNNTNFTTIIIASGTTLTIGNSNSLNLNGGLFRLVNYGTLIVSNGNFTMNGANSNGQIVENYGTISLGNDFRMQNSHSYFYNATSSSALNANNVFLPSSTNSIFVNQGQIITRGTTKFNSNTAALCSTRNSCISTKDIESDGTPFTNVNGNAFIQYTGNAQINGLFAAPNTSVQVCRASSATGPANASNWGSAQIINNCSYTTCPDMIKALPVELLYFRAHLNEQQVVLTWATNTEKNNAYFSIERSKDGKNFDVIGQVDGAGNSLEKRTYSAQDIAPLPGVSYYRLKQTDTDGSIFYSKIEAVEIKKESAIAIRPNPTENGNLRLYLPENSEKRVNVQIQNTMGKVLLEMQCQPQADGSIDIDLTNTFHAGIYFISVYTSGQLYREKFILQ